MIINTNKQKIYFASIWIQAFEDTTRQYQQFTTSYQTSFELNFGRGKMCRKMIKVFGWEKFRMKILQKSCSSFLGGNKSAKTGCRIFCGQFWSKKRLLRLPACPNVCKKFAASLLDTRGAWLAEKLLPTKQAVSFLINSLHRFVGGRKTGG